MAADITISSLSTVYLQIPVQVTAQGQPYDPVGDDVNFAFVNGSAYPATWYPGSWTTNIQGVALAQVLVGPLNGGIVLTPATYVIWVQIVDDPEVPVTQAGTMQIT